MNNGIHLGRMDSQDHACKESTGTCVRRHSRRQILGKFVRTVLNCDKIISHTVYPRVTHNYCALWKLQLRDLGLHTLILQGDGLDCDDFFSVTSTMNIGS